METPQRSTTPAKWVNLTANNFTPSPRLDYLALGDSYSSGEGDNGKTTTGVTYYRSWPNIMGESYPDSYDCHISTRSYPFILAADMHLPRSKWSSVACSGARTIDLGGQDTSRDFKDGTYIGQETGTSHTPRLSLVGSDEINEIRLQATQNFIPGRIQQLEFVKKYHPKVVTLTVGGNDVGFADILSACVLNPSVPATSCYWAQPQGIKDLGNKIKAEYGTLVTTYSSIKQASPGVKVYVVGYPQFIADDSCPAYVGLNAGERGMIVNGVTYLNQTIRAAAATAGVYYVDIEDALGAHTICGSSLQKYVNGIFEGKFISEDDTSIYHPNSDGHIAIASKINAALEGQTFATFNDCNSITIVCPQNSSTDIPNSTYFNPLNTYDRIVAFTSQIEDLTGKAVGYIKKGVDALVKINPQIASPNSVSIVTFHSDPIDLGLFTTDSNGLLSAEVSIPSSAEAGYHTIDIQSTSLSGKPIDIFQTILITGANTNDINDNGIEDELDKCLFVRAANLDSDLDGIDDACDPEISATPLVYRVRQGAANKTYNGLAENPNYLYIERNTYTSSVTGITGDYDPDSDGWAIVGASQGKPYSTVSVPDTAPAANFAIIGSGTNLRPYVYIRGGGYGCVSYTPTSLSKVLPSQNRTIRLVSENTNQCRQEIDSVDVDGNGIPDSVQPLYSARVGNPSIQHVRPDNTTFYEVATQTYLFRNFNASEAQLGISDYSPSGTAAGNSTQLIQAENLLASTQDSTMPAYNKLIVLNDSNGKVIPIVLTKKQNGQCIAYQPVSLDVIKMTTQYSNGFIRLASIPLGASCD